LIEVGEVRPHAPEAIILVLIEDQYRALGRDAEIIAPILGLQVHCFRCESRTIAETVIAAALIDGAVKVLRGAGHSVALAADPSGAQGNCRRLVITKQLGPPRPRLSPDERLAENVKKLPTPLRKIAAEFIKLEDLSQRVARHAICRWLKNCVLYSGVTETGGVAPACLGREDRLPDPAKLGAVAEIMATLSPNEQDVFVRMAKRFHEALPEHDDTELEDWTEEDDPVSLRLLPADGEPANNVELACPA
jgi:hypothetical protein